MLSIISGIIPACGAWVGKSIIDDVVARLQATDSTAELDALVWWMSAAVGLAVLGIIINWRRSVSQDWLQKAGAVEIDRILVERTQEIEVLERESPEFANRQMLIRMGSGALSTNLFSSAINIAQSVIRMLSFFGLLVAFSPGLAALSVAVGTIHGIIEIRYTRKRFLLRRGLIKLRRKLGVTRAILVNPFAAHEIQRPGTYTHLRDRMLSQGGRIRDDEHGLEKTTHLRRAVAGTVGALVSFVVYAGLLWQLLKGGITLGDVMLYRSAFGMVSGGVRGLGGSTAGLLSSDLELEHLFEFLDPSGRPEPTRDEGSLPFPSKLDRGFDIQRLLFQYPNMNRPIFEDLDLHLAAGNITAIVGPNGSGKTTLLKLLAGIYPPTGGRINLEERNIADYAAGEYADGVFLWGLGSTVYALTVRENISLCRLRDKDDDASIMAAAAQAGALEFINELPNGIDTMLTKTLDGGHQLSWGQNMRIILARALFVDPKVLLLDEPAAGLDQQARIAFLSLLRRLRHERIIVIATHQDFLTDIADTVMELVSSSEHGVTDLPLHSQ